MNKKHNEPNKDIYSNVQNNEQVIDSKLSRRKKGIYILCALGMLGLFVTSIAVPAALVKNNQDNGYSIWTEQQLNEYVKHNIIVTAEEELENRKTISELQAIVDETASERLEFDDKNEIKSKLGLKNIQILNKPKNVKFEYELVINQYANIGEHQTFTLNVYAYIADASNYLKESNSTIKSKAVQVTLTSKDFVQPTSLEELELILNTLLTIEAPTPGNRTIEQLDAIVVSSANGSNFIDGTEIDALGVTTNALSLNLQSDVEITYILTKVDSSVSLSNNVEYLLEVKGKITSGETPIESQRLTNVTLVTSDKYQTSQEDLQDFVDNLNITSLDNKTIKQLDRLLITNESFDGQKASEIGVDFITPAIMPSDISIFHTFTRKESALVENKQEYLLNISFRVPSRVNIDIDVDVTSINNVNQFTADVLGEVERFEQLVTAERFLNETIITNMPETGEYTSHTDLFSPEYSPINQSVVVKYTITNIDGFIAYMTVSFKASDQYDEYEFIREVNIRYVKPEVAEADEKVTAALNTLVDQESIFNYEQIIATSANKNNYSALLGIKNDDAVRQVTSATFTISDNHANDSYTKSVTVVIEMENSSLTLAERTKTFKVFAADKDIRDLQDFLNNKMQLVVDNTNRKTINELEQLIITTSDDGGSAFTEDKDGTTFAPTIGLSSINFNDALPPKNANLTFTISKSRANELSENQIYQLTIKGTITKTNGIVSASKVIDLTSKELVGEHLLSKYIYSEVTFTDPNEQSVNLDSYLSQTFIKIESDIQAALNINLDGPSKPELEAEGTLEIKYTLTKNNPVYDNPFTYTLVIMGLLTLENDVTINISKVPIEFQSTDLKEATDDELDKFAEFDVFFEGPQDATIATLNTMLGTNQILTDEIREALGIKYLAPVPLGMDIRYSLSQDSYTFDNPIKYYLTLDFSLGNWSKMRDLGTITSTDLAPLTQNDLERYIKNTITIGSIPNSSIGWMDQWVKGGFEVLTQELAMSNGTNLHKTPIGVTVEYQLVKTRNTFNEYARYELTIRGSHPRLQTVTRDVFTFDSSDLVPFKQTDLDTYVNQTITWSNPNRTTSYLNQRIGNNLSLNTQRAGELGIDLKNTPPNVTMTYTLTNTSSVFDQFATYDLIIMGDFAGLNKVTRNVIQFVSSDKVKLTQTELNNYVNNTITWTDTNRNIAFYDQKVSSTFVPLTSTIANDLGVNIGTLPTGVSLHYTFIKTQATSGTKAKYELKIRGSYTGLANALKSTINIYSSDLVSTTQAELNNFINNTITWSNPNMTISQLNAYVTTNGTITTNILGLSGITGNIPNGVAVHYSLTKIITNQPGKLSYSLSVWGTHVGLTDVTKGSITITSTDDQTPNDYLINNLRMVRITTPYDVAISQWRNLAGSHQIGNSASTQNVFGIDSTGINPNIDFRIEVSLENDYGNTMQVRINGIFSVRIGSLYTVTTEQYYGADLMLTTNNQGTLILSNPWVG